MTLPNPFPERLNPPDDAGECAICKREAHDGREIELCDEDVEGLRSRSMITLVARVETGSQWVCERCQQDLDAIHCKANADAFRALSDALGWDSDEHPALHVRRLVTEIEELRGDAKRLQSSTSQDVESLIHAVAMAAWDHGADCGTVWCPDADMSKRGVVPCTQEEGFQESRAHFAKHGSGSPVGEFEVALNALRARLQSAPAPKLTCEQCVERDGCPRRGKVCMYHDDGTVESSPAPVVVPEMGPALEFHLPYSGACSAQDNAGYRLGFRVGWNALASRLRADLEGEELERIAGIAKDAAYRWMGQSSPNPGLYHVILDALRSQATTGGEVGG